MIGFYPQNSTFSGFFFLNCRCWCWCFQSKVVFCCYCVVVFCIQEGFIVQHNCYFFFILPATLRNPGDKTAHTTTTATTTKSVGGGGGGGGQSKDKKKQQWCYDDIAMAQQWCLWHRLEMQLHLGPMCCSLVTSFESGIALNNVFKKKEKKKEKSQ